MQTYEKLAHLPLQIDGYNLELLQADVSSGFTRYSNVISLSGSGFVGTGEDVTYEADDQKILNKDGRGFDLAFEGTFGEFSNRLGGLDLFPQPPTVEVYRNYRRWGFEAAALDLALQQAGTSFDEAVGKPYRPVRFVLSQRLGDPPSFGVAQKWLDAVPGLEFKLDAESSWSRELMEQLAATGAVESIDLKGMYKGTSVDQAADPRLYRDVIEVFKDAWIEDPAFTPETREILLTAKDRITWDAPIHSIADIEALEFKPRGLNIKPSRFGSLQDLLAGIEYCERESITMYSGGQFELGVGRQQLHALASLFFADGPNDVAPGDFNLPDPTPGLPSSPLAPPESPVGFRWQPSGL